MKILQIDTSARREGANSTHVASSAVEHLRSTTPDAVLKVRDLAVEPIRVLDGTALGALFTLAERRTPEQSALAA